MATAAKSPTRSTTGVSKRAAAVAREPRDSHGRWKRSTASPVKSASGSDYSTGAVVGAAAAGLAIGLAANVARKLAVQAPTALAGDWDQALAAEHQAVLKIFDALEATEDGSRLKRGTLLAALKHALAKHAMEEENVIYPALREAGEIEAADALTKEHGYVKQYLYELGEMPKDSGGFLLKLAAFRAELEAHMREEEDSLFPRLKLRLTPDKSRELTVMVNKEGLKIA